MYRNTRLTLLALFTALAVVAGCDDGSSNDSSDQAAQQQESEHGHQHEGGEEHHADRGDDESGESPQNAELVDVPDDGTKYKPSVKAEQIPEGAWHCNMNGKVHYAALNKGDGECPVCGMDLLEKGNK